MNAALRHPDKPKLDLRRINFPTVREMRQKFISALSDEAKVAGNAIAPLRRMKSAYMFLIVSWKDERTVFGLRKAKIPEVPPQLALQMIFYRVDMDYRIQPHLTNRSITRLRQ
ncbi:hypothetical protein mvi_00460 [Methylobacterium indicum]|uniref:Uncharacterized protein n=1 Tax=Methylobacterium indicum TaxID=1775910 RepID=A0A8H8WNT2_9HYPH|nr:hypothetical protein mvi_00460 [Methylobacterium indicum]